jgi:hypothetical protein
MQPEFAYGLFLCDQVRAVCPSRMLGLPVRRGVQCLRGACAEQTEGFHNAARRVSHAHGTV